MSPFVCGSVSHRTIRTSEIICSMNIKCNTYNNLAYSDGKVAYLRIIMMRENKDV